MTQTSEQQSNEAFSNSSAEEKERQRRTDLQQQGFRIADEKQAEQATREREQLRATEARRESMERLNASHGTTNGVRPRGSPAGYYDASGNYHSYRN